MDTNDIDENMTVPLPGSNVAAYLAQDDNCHDHQQLDSAGHPQLFSSYNQYSQASPASTTDPMYHHGQHQQPQTYHPSSNNHQHFQHHQLNYSHPNQSQSHHHHHHHAANHQIYATVDQYQQQMHQHQQQFGGQQHYLQQQQQQDSQHQAYLHQHQQSQFHYGQQQHQSSETPPPQAQTLQQQQQPRQQQPPRRQLSTKNLHDHMVGRLNEINQLSLSNGKLLKDVCKKQEEIVIQNQERGIQFQRKILLEEHQEFTAAERLKADISNCERVIKEMANDLKVKKAHLYDQFINLYNQVDAVENEIINDYIPKWHHNQQLAQNGAQDLENINLDHMQVWCEMIYDIVWRTRNQLKAFHIFLRNIRCAKASWTEVNQLGFALNRCIETLVLHTMLVEKQPPQVMKTNTRFTSTVRLLVGSRMNVQNVLPPLKVNIVSEINARTIKQRHMELIKSSWEFNKPESEQQMTYSQQEVNNQMMMQPSMTPSPLNGPVSPSIHPPPPSLASLQSDYSTPIATNIKNDNSSELVNRSPTSATMIYQQQPSTPRQQQPQDIYPKLEQLHSPAPSTISNISIPTPSFNEKKMLNLQCYEPSGEILNSSNLIEYHDNSKHVNCQFRNMQLKKIKRTEKKGTESVMDEKFILLFHCYFRIADSLIGNNDYGLGVQPVSNQHTLPWMNQGDLQVHMMAFSLPVVVIVHGNQEPHAWATVTWHNAFARRDNIMYHVPDSVYWHELGHVLSNKFRTNVGRGLSPANLEYLGRKISRTEDSAKVDIVSWNQFAKETLPEKSFTFWEWFHSVLKLTKEHLRNLWNADRIYGFVNKKGCIELLLGCQKHEPKPSGTFLLRYSETELGGITIAWVPNSTKELESPYSSSIQVLQRRSPTSNTSSVLLHLQPFSSKDLNTRTLADRIRDLEDLMFLYPNIPKDEAFCQFYTPMDKLSTCQPEDYVQPMLIQTLVTNYAKSSILSTSMDYAVTPATPTSQISGSPNGIYQDNGSSTIWSHNLENQSTG